MMVNITLTELPFLLHTVRMCVKIATDITVLKSIFVSFLCLGRTICHPSQSELCASLFKCGNALGLKL